jgi:hypothetical protein
MTIDITCPAEQMEELDTALSHCDNITFKVGCVLCKMGKMSLEHGAVSVSLEHEPLETQIGMN